MILKQIFDQVALSDVLEFLDENYDDIHGPSYTHAWNELQDLEPLKTDMVIGIFYVEDVVEGVEEPYHDVRGQNKHSEFGEEFVWALSLMDWGEWLGMEVYQETLDTYTPVEIIGCCLWEMTWHGYSMESIDIVDAEIRETTEQIQADIESGEIDNYPIFWESDGNELS